MPVSRTAKMLQEFEVEPDASFETSGGYLLDRQRHIPQTGETLDRVWLVLRGGRHGRAAHRQGAGIARSISPPPARRGAST
jgi:hypothetical protein